MKTNKKHIIIPALMMAVGVGLVGSISGTVAWYQYSTRATTSYIGASNKCSENLQVSLNGSDFVSELDSTAIKGAARTNADGTKLQPVTPGVAQTNAMSTSDGEISSMYGHPIYQNFTYDKWQAAPANSYLQYDLYFRVLDVDGAATANYLAKKLYIEDITLNYTPTSASASTNAATSFKDAVRVQFDNVTGGTSSQRLLLSNTATSALPLGGELDLNGDGSKDKNHGYEWETTAVTEYGDKTKKQTTAAFSSYMNSYVNGKLSPTANTEIGTTVAGQYSASTALHFKVTVWLEGWANTQMWSAADYIGSFQLGMTFGVTAYGEA